MTYYLPCSKISQAIGRNPYEDRASLIVSTASQLNEELAEEINKEEIENNKAVENFIKSTGLEDILELAKEEDLEKEKSVNEIMKIMEKVVGEEIEENEKKKIEEKIERITKVKVNISELKDVKKEHIKSVKSSMNTSIGIRREQKTIDGLKKEENIVVENNNSQTYTHVFPFSLKIVGRTDGSHEDKLVEIKNRRNRYLGVTKYDKVQVMSYMFLTGKRKCCFIEDLNGKRKQTELLWDQKYWNTIEKDLEKFTNDVIKLNSNNVSS